GGERVGGREGAAGRAQALEELAVGGGRIGGNGGGRGGAGRRGPRRPHEVDEGRTAAEVARGAAGGDRFVEVGDQVRPAAPRRLREVEHRARLPPRLAPQLDVLDAVLEALVRDHVGPRVEEDDVARQAVAAGPADL